jgi:hypothetical protein
VKNLSPIENLILSLFRRLPKILVGFSAELDKI